MIQEVIKKMIIYNGSDVKRVNHALKVFGFASTICRSENLSENEILIVETLGILHDIGIQEAEKKYNSSNGKYQEIEGPPIAHQMLLELGFKLPIIERICYIIANHHNYSKIDGIDFQILVEADFLVNIDEDKITALESIREKYFKTNTGKLLFDKLYT